ncbi:MAG: xanthine dehydrogenase family protein molybdopterin-binding subunit [Deltaproteobacteria bacterium]
MRRPSEAPSGFVGRSPARLDGEDKVTGRARYLDDLTFPGQLWGRTVRSSVAHARLRQVEFDPAFDWTGIVRVTADDIPGENVVSLIDDDQPCLVKDVIRHCHEPIALLACDDRERLEEALRHVRVEVEPLPPVFDALASQKSFKRYQYEKEGERLAQIFASADRVIFGAYRVGHQEQLYIEPNAVCAVPRPDGGITLHGSMQCPFYIHRALLRLLGLTDERLSVIQTITGGGFGGKEDYPSIIAGHAALLARKAGRPVKIVYARDEDIAATTKRHPAVVTHNTAVRSDGTLLGCEIDIVFDGGAYCTLSPVVLSRGAIHAPGAYRWPACRVTARAVQTNTPPNGAFRGFGAPQTLFAIEMQMEKVARELGMDPLELRRKNALVPGDLTATGQELRHSVSTLEVLERVALRSGWAERASRRTDPKSRLQRGMGLSLVLHGAGFTGSGEVKLKARAGVALTPTGCRVLSASTEIGQGTITIFTQMVADALGVPLAAVAVENPDTSRVPDSGPTVASRTCMVVGGTLAGAATALRRTLSAFAAGLHGLAPEQVDCRAGVFCAGERPLTPFSELAARWLLERGPLEIIEQYSHPPGIEWDDDEFLGDAYPVYAWAATAVELEVDLDSYETKLLRVVTAQDVGKAIHPVLCEGQIEGGTVQALGWALMEELVHRDGKVVNDRLQSYLIPTALDVPPIETILVENPYPHGPYGAKGVGELPMDGPAPAVTAAILDATGLHVPELPVTPERLRRFVVGKG